MTTARMKSFSTLYDFNFVKKIISVTIFRELKVFNSIFPFILSLLQLVLQNNNIIFRRTFITARKRCPTALQSNSTIFHLLKQT